MNVNLPNSNYTIQMTDGNELQFGEKVLPISSVQNFQIMGGKKVRVWTPPERYVDVFDLNCYTVQKANELAQLLLTRIHAVQGRPERAEDNRFTMELSPKAWNSAEEKEGLIEALRAPTKNQPMLKLAALVVLEIEEVPPEAQEAVRVLVGAYNFCHLQGEDHLDILRKVGRDPENP